MLVNVQLSVHSVNTTNLPTLGHPIFTTFWQKKTKKKPAWDISQAGFCITCV